MVGFLEERLTDDLDIFEFGSGYSTIFYGQRAKSVVAVEHNEKWVEILREKLPDNVDLRAIALDDSEDYENSIVRTGRVWDVVVVDGRRRMKCFRNSIEHLTLGGVVLLDDSYRTEYREAFELAEARGFRNLKFTGVSARKFGQDETTVFYRSDNCLGI